MKNVVLAIVFVAIGGLLSAQNAKVTTAGNYLKQDELIKAKVAIDEASVHVKTQGQPKTLMYVGKIYYAIAIDTTDATKEFRNGAIFTSADAFKGVKESGDNRIDETELNKFLYLFVYNKMWDDGVAFYNGKDYVQAAKHFAGCADIRGEYEELDTLGYYYAANASAAAEDYEKSIEYYSKIKDSGYKEGAIYGSISTQYKALGDTAKAVETLEEGRKIYPDNQQLLIAEFNVYVEMGETEKAIANIDKAIAADPEKASYYYVRGKLKESLGDLASAEVDYKKTLEIDPNHLDANHDLGALYVNESRTIVEQMNNLPLSAAKEYDAKKAELDGIYTKALPYLKKAYELDPSDKEVQGILLKLYLRTNDTENYNKIKADMDNASAE